MKIDTKVDFDEVVDAFKKVDAQVKNETGRGFAQITVDTALILTALVKARRHAKRGNYLAGIYYLLMWHSLKSTANSSAIYHRLAKDTTINNNLFN